MSKNSAKPGHFVSVAPRHRDAWGAIFSHQPHQTAPSVDWALDKVDRRRPGAKGLMFIADSANDLRDFPQVARHRVGYQLHLVQSGEEPSDWSPTSTVGPGCCQVRVQHLGDAYRVSYVASLGDTVYVLDCSQNHGPQTAASDLELGRRYEQMSALIRTEAAR